MIFFLYNPLHLNEKEEDKKSNEPAKPAASAPASKQTEKEKRTEEQIIALSTTRNVDAVFAKLQKKHDVFKPKVPLLTGNPITAKIGMKEGLEGGDKYEVLEQSADAEGKITYKRKGVISVDKKKSRFMEI